MDEDNYLELLELYMEMTEKQDEIICRLGTITARLAADLALLRNDQHYSEEGGNIPGRSLEQDMAIIQETVGQYKKTKESLEP